MDFDSLKKFLFDKPGSKLEFPFGPDTLVFKVMGKMYTLVSWQADPLRISVKCDPEEAIILREKYSAIQPAYHMSKIHWNTITLDGTIPDEEIYAMINESFRLVVAVMPKHLFRTLVKIKEKQDLEKKLKSTQSDNHE
jgi:predicted DNA-binding protein (MmcQ/YjbR family)